MNAEQLAEETLQKYGVPHSEALYRAILEMVFTRGRIEGAMQIHQKLTCEYAGSAVTPLRVVK